MRVWGAAHHPVMVGSCVLAYILNEISFGPLGSFWLTIQIVYLPFGSTPSAFPMVPKPNQEMKV